MRIDKYLKNSRLIKRRAVAKDACDQGKISVNGKIAKAGTEIQVGDRIDLDFGIKKIAVEVTSLTEHVTKEASKDMFKELV